ncbi:MAG: pyrolysin (pls), partial [Palaeococcus sp.]|nr:pyrolysin (pls) [Palaeococcus sp. (in: euryarchaeotes)]
IGGTSEEKFEKLFPDKGYYYVYVHGYDTAGLNPIQFIYYEQILKDNGDVSVDTTPFEFKSGDTKTITANVNLSEEGTYLGVLGIRDSESGATLTYAPMILQVGQPEMYVALMGTAIIGEPSTLTLKILDKATLDPVEGEVKVIINGKEYYAEDGELKFTYTATTFNPAPLNIKVISDEYRDFEGKFSVSVGEKFTEIIGEGDIENHLVEGAGTITNFKSHHGDVKLTVSGDTGDTATVMITLPLDAHFIEITGDHIVSHYIEKGKYAQYVFVTVQFASDANIEIKYRTNSDIIRTMDILWYMLYTRYNEKFNETYNRAVELGVDNETLQEAMKYKDLADQYYEEAWQFGHPMQGHIQAAPYLRRAYMNIKKALEILNKAIQSLE